jgi:biopolymer transport protein ExbD
MKIQTSGRPPLSLESVAMTDIVMNMFIFFFVSFSLLYTFNPHQESKIKVILPKGLTRTQLMGETPLVVTVSAKNLIYMDNKLIPEQTLQAELARNAQRAKQNGVIIKADRRANVDFFVKVLDAARQAGANKVSIAIELQKKE